MLPRTCGKDEQMSALALTGHDAMSDLSPLSGVRRKSDLRGRPISFWTRTGSAGISWTVGGFRSSSCRKVAQKLKQRRVDFGRPLLLKPMAGILHQPDVVKVGALLTHQFDHIDAGYHAEDRFEAASHKGGWVRKWLAVKRGKLFKIAFGVAIAIERAPEPTGGAIRRTCNSNAL